MSTSPARRPPVARQRKQQIARERAQRAEQRRTLLEPLRHALRDKRGSRKWMVEQLATRAHISVSQQTMSNYLNGHSAMLRDTLTWMCAIAGVPLVKILRSPLAEALVLQANPHPTRYRPRQPREQTKQAVTLNT